MAMTLYYTKVLTPTEVVERGAVVISDEGHIAYVGPMEDAPRVDGLRLDMRHRIVVPGFIDVHVHGGNGIKLWVDFHPWNYFEAPVLPPFDSDSLL